MRELLVRIAFSLAGAALAIAVAVVAPMVARSVDPALPSLVSKGLNVGFRPMTVMGTSHAADGVRKQSSKLPELELKVKNTGDSRAVLEKVELRVQGFFELIPCGGGSGFIEVTGRYGTVIPASPRVGRVIGRVLSQEVDPDGVDRFAVILQRSRQGDAYGLYRFGVTVVYDDGRRLDMGSAVVAFPKDPSESEMTPVSDEATDYSKCMLQRRRATAGFLRAPGARTAELRALTGKILRPYRAANTPAPESDLRKVEWDPKEVAEETCPADAVVDLEKPIYGDLDRDGNEEAAIGFFCNNGNGNILGTVGQGYRIYTDRSDGPTPLGTVIAQMPKRPSVEMSPYVAQIKLRPGRIVATEHFYLDNDPNCCPTGRAVTTWTKGMELTPGRPVVLPARS